MTDKQLVLISPDLLQESAQAVQGRNSIIDPEVGSLAYIKSKDVQALQEKPHGLFSNLKWLDFGFKKDKQDHHRSVDLSPGTDCDFQRETQNQIVGEPQSQIHLNNNMLDINLEVNLKKSSGIGESTTDNATKTDKLSKGGRKDLFRKLKLTRLDRPKSLEKPSIDIIEKQPVEIARPNQTKFITQLLETDMNVIPIRTRVISRASKKIEQVKETNKIVSNISSKNLTELLHEIVSRSDSSDEMIDDEDFDFDKESEKCQEQLNMIKDAYVVDLPDPDVDNQQIHKESEDSNKGSQDALLSFKKIAYFTSVAATTGFYFLLRKHSIL